MSGHSADKIQDALNRSRRERLNKAAKQGYGPLVDLGLVNAPQPFSRYERNELEQAGNVAIASQSSQGAETRRKTKDQVLRRGGKDEEDADVSGFLAPKRPGSVQQKATGSSKLEVRISAGTNSRAIAANAGARPKAAPAKGGQDADELRLRQLEELTAHEFAKMQSEAKKVVQADDEPVEALRDLSPSEEIDGDRETRRKEKRELKRKREEWRKKRKEDKKKRKKEGRKSESSRSADESEEEAAPPKAEPAEDPKDSAKRFMMWRALNNNGVTTARDVQRKYVGQVTDAALDMRLREAQPGTGSGKLMTEAEALAKLQRKAR